jgi:hypothetical protein
MQTRAAANVFKSERVIRNVGSYIDGGSSNQDQNPGGREVRFNFNHRVVEATLAQWRALAVESPKIIERTSPETRKFVEASS